MLITTTDTISGKTLETLGLVKGNVVQSTHIGRDFMAGVKAIFGGEIKSYTDMLTKNRELAISRMTEEATALNADAIVGMRMVSGSVMQGTSEVVAFGTAVKIIGETAFA